MILTDAEFLKFENLEQIDFGQEELEQPIANQVPVEYNVASKDVDESFGML